jgi:hypothetical protein
MVGGEAILGSIACFLCSFCTCCCCLSDETCREQLVELGYICCSPFELCEERPLDIQELCQLRQYHVERAKLVDEYITREKAIAYEMYRRQNPLAVPPTAYTRVGPVYIWSPRNKRPQVATPAYYQ